MVRVQGACFYVWVKKDNLQTVRMGFMSHIFGLSVHMSVLCILRDRMNFLENFQKFTSQEQLI